MLTLVVVWLVSTACGSPSVRLTTKRLGHTSEAIGSYLYVFGGGGLNTLERAKVGSDGSLNDFEKLTDVTLVSGLTGHTSAVIGGYVYIFGGAADGGLSSATVERAPINSDGSLAAFAIVSGGALETPRVTHASVATDSHVYVLGGSQGGNNLLDSVERAPINADGTLGPFATLAVHLQTARRNFTSLALGGYLYVFGGSGPSGDLDTIERASIGTDGSLAAFETLTDVKLGSAGLDQAFVHIGDRVDMTGGLHGALIPSSTVASAPVGADGTLAGFTDSPASLTVARGSHTATVASGFVYVLGGLGTSGIITNVERAAINGDGTLDDFENLSD